MKNILLACLILSIILTAGAAAGCSGLNGNDATTHYNKGVSLSDAGNYNDAAAEYTSAIEIDKNYVNAYINRGYVYYQLKQYEAAVADYTKAIMLAPGEYKAFNGRGASYLNSKQYQQALDDFKSSLTIKPDQPQIVTNRDYAAKMLGTDNDNNNDNNYDDRAVRLTGTWLDNGSNPGLQLYDGGSRWKYNVELTLEEDAQGNFQGTMTRTLYEITGPVTSEPEIMKWVGDVQTCTVTGTRNDTAVDFVFGELTLRLNTGTDSYGVYLFGDTHFFDAGSPIDSYKKLLSERPPGVSGQDYIEWIYSINLKRK